MEPVEIKHKKFGSVSFDFWPLSDFWRLSYTRWNGAHYAQICIGPIRIDWACQ